MEYTAEKEEYIVLPQRKGVARVNAEYMTNEMLNKIGGIILDACITVHRELGPGLLEYAYTTALVRELEIREINIRIQVPVEIEYKGEPFG